MTAASYISEDEIRHAVGNVLAMPDEVRRLVAGPRRAQSEFGVDAALLDRLRAAGLPCREDGAGGWLVDPTDLMNIALQLDFGSPQRLALGWWGRELGRPYGDEVTYGMDYVVACPEPEHTGPCHYDVLYPRTGYRRHTTTDREPSAIARTEFRLRRTWPALPPAVIELLDQTGGVRFMRLSQPVRWNPEFVVARRVGDCYGVGQLLLQRGRERGLEVRFARGQALTPPFSSAHYWTEFRVEGEWTPVDPVLIDAMLDWGLLPGDRWTRNDSIGGILGRITDARRRLATHNGGRVPVKHPAYRIR